VAIAAIMTVTGVAPVDSVAWPDGEPLVLRPSRELARAPVPRADGLAPAAAPAATGAPAAIDQPVPGGTTVRGPAAPRNSWLLVGAAAIATFGWLVERRRRRLLETEKDSVLWADIQPPGASILTTARGLSQILPDSPNPAEAARAIYVTAIGETISRREATLIDLHQLDSKLKRRRKRGDVVAAVLLLQEHLVDFRYTSPWVFLELLELYRQLGRREEWDITRVAFTQRFGQAAPAWDEPSTEDAQLLGDAQLCAELEQVWPYRESRMFVLRWMLGEHAVRPHSDGPPLLGLGVYRDLMLLDEVLDDVLDLRTEPPDSLP
jgi:hypothetical protein